MKIMKICALLLVLMLMSAASEELSKRIIGGSTCDTSERQYHVEVETMTTKNRCGGSLLSPGWVITAARCTTGGPVTVKIGVRISVLTKLLTWMTGPLKQIIPVSQQISYKTLGMNHIMLLRLNKVVSTKLPTIRLPAHSSCTPPAVGTSVRIGGWGATHTDQIGKEQPEKLQCANMLIEECKEIDQDLHRELNYTICAFKQSVDSCPGDAGSAMEFNGRLYGVINRNPLEKCDHTVDIVNICPYIKAIKGTFEQHKHFE